MPTSASRTARLAVFLAVVAGLFPAGAADTKPDKKRSLAAMQRGKKADDAGQRNEAIAAYSEAIQADASNAEAWRARGRDYLAADDRPKAQADFDKAIEIQPGGAENYLARGEFFSAIGEPERAIHDYSLAINLNLERTEVYTARGKAYSEVRQFERAEEDFTKAIKLRIDNPEPYKGRGMALFALALKADDLRALRVRGAVRERLDDNEGALADYTEAIRRDPSDARLFLVRGAQGHALVRGMDPGEEESVR